MAAYSQKLHIRPHSKDYRREIREKEGERTQEEQRDDEVSAEKVSVWTGSRLKEPHYSRVPNGITVHRHGPTRPLLPSEKYCDGAPKSFVRKKLNYRPSLREGEKITQSITVPKRATPHRRPRNQPTPTPPDNLREKSANKLFLFISAFLVINIIDCVPSPCRDSFRRGINNRSASAGNPRTTPGLLNQYRACADRLSVSGLDTANDLYE